MNPNRQPPANLTLRTTPSNKTTAVAICGQIVGSGGSFVRDTLIDLLESGCKRLAVDLSATTGLDTAAIGGLATTSLWALHCKANFGILPSEIVRHALTKANLPGYLSLIESV